MITNPNTGWITFDNEAEAAAHPELAAQMKLQRFALTALTNPQQWLADQLRLPDGSFGRVSANKKTSGYSLRSHRKCTDIRTKPPINRGGKKQ